MEDSEGNGRTHDTAPLYFSGSIIPETTEKDAKMRGNVDMWKKKNAGLKYRERNEEKSI